MVQFLDVVDYHFGVLVLDVNHNIGENELLVSECFSSFWIKRLNILLRAVLIKHMSRLCCRVKAGNIPHWTDVNPPLTMRGCGWIFLNTLRNHGP